MSTKDKEDDWVDTSTARRRPVVQSVPNDWEDDEDDDPRPATNRKLWEDANRNEPMPQVIETVGTLPSAAFAPAMRILKRPTQPTDTSRTSSPSGSQQKSFTEREAEYEAVRQRIFSNGADSPSLSPPPAPSARKQQSPQPDISRNTNPSLKKTAGITRLPVGPSPSPTGFGFESRSRRRLNPNETPPNAPADDIRSDVHESVEK